MDLSKAFETDEKLENEGAWIDIGGGALVCVARVGNKKYNEHFEKAIKPHRRQFRTGTMRTELMDEILIDTLAHTILLGWEGVEYKGEPIEYSVANAIMVMTDLKDFRALIAEIAGEMETFKREEDEDAAKNSDRSSDGDSNGETATTS